MYHHVREGADDKALTPDDCNVTACVVDFLRKFVAKPIPALMRLSLKNYHSYNPFKLPLMDVREVDEILLHYHLAEGTRIAMIQGWHSDHTPEKYRPLLRTFYHKLSERGLLEFHV